MPNSPAGIRLSQAWLPPPPSTGKTKAHKVVKTKQAPTPQTGATTWRAFRLRYTSRPFAPRTASSLPFGKKNQKLRAVADPGASSPGSRLTGDCFGPAQSPTRPHCARIGPVIDGVIDLCLNGPCFVGLAGWHMEQGQASGGKNNVNEPIPLFADPADHGSYRRARCQESVRRRFA